MARDHYQTLGVDRRASDKEIKAAYRRLARQLHPDVTGDDPRATARFKEVSEAYECLSDPKKRKTYDLFGPSPSPVDLGDVRESLKQSVAGLAASLSEFWNRRPARAPEPGLDAEAEVEATFQEAFSGAKKEVEVELWRSCAACGGQGIPADAARRACTSCGGNGKATFPGPLPLRRPCSTCGGSGEVYTRTCRPCSGMGRTRRRERLRVTLPAGVAEGTQLRLKGRGDAGTHGGPAGDLYVRVRVREDPRFVREGDDILTQVRIPLRDAVLGTSVWVPLPAGSAKMVVPPGTQGGQVFRLRGQGFPHLQGSGAGDALVTLQLRVPTSLDDEDRQLLEHLGDKWQA